MRLAPILPCLFFILSCSQSNDHVESSNQKRDSIPLGEETNLTQPVAAAYTAEIFETPELGWGYKIFDNGVLFINQPHIPAIQGNKGFSTKEKAEITAKFAILKLEQGFVPPTISPEELDSLGVLD